MSAFVTVFFICVGLKVLGIVLKFVRKQYQIFLYECYQDYINENAPQKKIDQTLNQLAVWGFPEGAEIIERKEDKKEEGEKAC